MFIVIKKLCLSQKEHFVEIPLFIQFRDEMSWYSSQILQITDNLYFSINLEPLNGYALLTIKDCSFGMNSAMTVGRE